MNSSIDPAISGPNLAAARRARGLTQQEAADAIGVSRTTITAIEKGERLPRSAEIIELASIYGRNVSELVRPAPVTERNEFIVQFRSARVPNRAPGDEDFETDIAEFQRLCEDYVRLEQMTSAPLPRRYPEVYAIAGTDSERAAEEVASTERHRLGLGDGPIGDLWGLLESDIGLRIFMPRFTHRRLAGLFGYTDELGGCIAVNGNQPEERRRWTAAHEYGHFLVDRYRAEITTLPSYRRVPESERFADAFARCFLMPSSGLVRRVQSIRRSKEGPITPADVLSVAALYRVSFEAMILNLEDLKLIKAGSWDRLREAGFKTNTSRASGGISPVRPEHAMLPIRYETLAVRAFVAEHISEGDLARFLRTDRVSARERVHVLAETQIYESGEWFQMSIDLGTALTTSA